MSALVPNSVDINQTNAVSGYGSLGEHSKLCKQMWGRYPSNLLVDFYDSGNGSVFEVAAKANNVTYLGGCCGKVKSLASGGMLASRFVLLSQAGLLAAFFLLG